MGENLCQKYIWQGIARVYSKLKKLNSQRINDPMKKGHWTEQSFFYFIFYYHIIVLGVYFDIYKSAYGTS
jgi:hypothetical protein